MSFADHFSKLASAYAQFRPSYPDELGAWLASVAPGTNQVWDCATGSGQAATMLARHFGRVMATDASDGQIRNAQPCERVQYAVAPAEASGLPAGSCDLVTVAQAAHWLNLPAFYLEVRRVLKPGGVIALWCYALLETGDAEVDASVRRLAYERVGAYWPPGRELVEDHYQSLDFPFAEIKAPSFAMTASWNRDALIGYAGTWSAVAKSREVNGEDPIEPFAQELERLWSNRDQVREMRWPLYLRVGRVSRP